MTYKYMCRPNRTAEVQYCIILYWPFWGISIIWAIVSPLCSFVGHNYVLRTKNT